MFLGIACLKESYEILLRHILTFINLEILKGKNKIEKICVLNLCYIPK